jgi:hypothetical protein
MKRSSMVMFTFLAGLVSGRTAEEADKGFRAVPAGDLIAQAEFFLGRIAESLSGAGGYDEPEQARVQKDSQTLAILYLCLARHEQQHALSGVAAAQYDAARQIAESYKDSAKAKAALEKLAAVSKGTPTTGNPPAWRPVGEIPVQMKHSQFVENRMKRGLSDERSFKRRAKETAGYVATMAAFGQVWRLMAPKDDPHGKWAQFSDEQREAAGTLNGAIHKQDWPAARDAARTLTQSCNACHDIYRKAP